MRKYRDFVIQTMRDPDEAIAYLQSSLEEFEKDGNSEAFLIALRTVAEAKGGISELSKKTDLNRQALYKILSKKGNPRLKTLNTVLNSLGFKLSIQHS